MVAQIIFTSYPNSLLSGRCSGAISIEREPKTDRSDFIIELSSPDKKLSFYQDKACKYGAKGLHISNLDTSIKFYVYYNKVVGKQASLTTISAKPKLASSINLALQVDSHFFGVNQPQRFLAARASLNQAEGNLHLKDTMSSSFGMSLAKNETGSAIFNVSLNECQKLNLPSKNGIQIKLFRMKSVRTTTPSFIGNSIGDYFDPLVPVDLTGGEICPSDKWIWADFVVDESSEAGKYTFFLGDVKASISVWNFALPRSPSFNFYIPLASRKILQAHSMLQNEVTEERLSLLDEYVRLLRDHRIEPIGQRTQDPVKLVEGKIEIDANFSRLVIQKSIAPICLIFPTKIGLTWKSGSVLRAWEKLIAGDNRFSNAWAYVTDEPEDIAGTSDRLKQTKSFAPSLKLMVTHEPTEELIGLVDYFAVNFDHFKTKGHWSNFNVIPEFWLYGSCMSHGSCTNGKIGKLTGTPDLMLDEPNVFSRAYPVVAFALGASSALYYDATFAIQTAWTNQYFFGGNGDGTLLYPGLKSSFNLQKDIPIPSVRLKSIRQGLYDIEYIKLARSNGMGSFVDTIINDQFVWSKNYKDYDKFREQIGNALSIGKSEISARESHE